MTIKTTAAVLAALTFLATPIAAQAQNASNTVVILNNVSSGAEREISRTIVDVDLSALQTRCTSASASFCKVATTAALDAYKNQNRTRAINAQIGLIAAILVQSYNANNDLWQIAYAIDAMKAYSNDQPQKDALKKIYDLMIAKKPVPLIANASALSPS